MRELKSGMPQLDPCCFPLLHPRGTLGFRWFMKKNGMQRELTDEEKRMQEELDRANQQEMKDLIIWSLRFQMMLLMTKTTIISGTKRKMTWIKMSQTPMT